MKMIAVLILITSMPVHAGWWSNFCERHLIADDPYQWEQYPTAWIEFKIYSLEVAVRNRMASDKDIRMLVQLKQEMENRAAGL